MNTETVKNNIKKIYRDYATAFSTITENSWNKKIATLRPGETTPRKGEFYFDDDINKFREIAEEYRDKGLSEINRVLDRISEVKATAPSTEAVNYISMMRDKKNLSEHDIDIALDHYGDNYSTYNAIVDIAEDRKLYNIHRNNPLDALETRFEELKDNMNKISSFTAQRQAPTDGYIAFTESIIDTIPDCII